MYLVVWVYISNHLVTNNGSQYLNYNSQVFDVRKDALEYAWSLLQEPLMFDVQLYKREKLPFAKE